MGLRQTDGEMEAGLGALFPTSLLHQSILSQAGALSGARSMAGTRAEIWHNRVNIVAEGRVIRDTAFSGLQVPYLIRWGRCYEEKEEQ